LSTRHCASHLLNIAVRSGYEASGISISSISTAEEKVVVAIRTDSIGFDIPVTEYNQDIRTLRLFSLNQGYFHNVFRLVNHKFQ
jgi:tRNA(Phe) wybutosine-synthesizing methylase Tyw3